MGFFITIHNRNMKLIFVLFVAVLIAANLIVKHFGPWGLLITSFTLIPFDFVLRCVIHERLTGSTLFFTLLLLVCAAAVCTILINWSASRVALASICGFTAAQAVAGVFYQWRKAKGDSYFVKVNGSDLLAIVADSILFQLVAFSAIGLGITGGQIMIKVAGGLIWYYVIFILFKLQYKYKFYEGKSSRSK